MCMYINKSSVNWIDFVKGTSNFWYSQKESFAGAFIYQKARLSSTKQMKSNFKKSYLTIGALLEK